VTDNLIAGIVRIPDPSGDTVGTGFVLTSDGLLVTCVHVIESVGVVSGDPIRLSVQHHM